MVNTINKLEAYQKIRYTKGLIFRANFVKKDGTIRVMVARLGVKKGVTGTGLAFEPFEKLLLPVYDMQKKEFRMINLNSVQELKINGTNYKVL